MERSVPAVFQLHLQSFDLSVTRDLWIVLVTGICPVVIAFSKQRRR
jgi:hypothetical protein